jgi:hypothetical protein
VQTVIDNLTKPSKSPYGRTATLDVLAAIRHYSNKHPSTPPMSDYSMGTGSFPSEGMPVADFLSAIHPVSVASYFIVSYWSEAAIAEHSTLAGLGVPENLDPDRTGWNCDLLHHIIVVSALYYLQREEELTSASPDKEKIKR